MRNVLLKPNSTFWLLSGVAMFHTAATLILPKGYATTVVGDVVPLAICGTRPIIGGSKRTQPNQAQMSGYSGTMSCSRELPAVGWVLSGKPDTFD